MNTRIRTNQNFENDLMDDPPTLKEMLRNETPDVGTGRYAIAQLALAVSILKFTMNRADPLTEALLSRLGELNEG